MMVLGELAQAAAAGRSAIGLDEVGLLLAGRFVDARFRTHAPAANPPARDRRRAVEAALWIDAHSHEPIVLDDAAGEAGLSAFHFLRLFSEVLGVTPHQYLVRSRLRHAARLLADDDRPSPTRVRRRVRRPLELRPHLPPRGWRSPRGFRKAAKGDRKIFQDRLAAFSLR